MGLRKDDYNQMCLKKCAGHTEENGLEESQNKWGQADKAIA